MGVFKDDRAVCELIDVRSGLPVIAIAAQCIGSQRVKTDLKHVKFRSGPQPLFQSGDLRLSFFLSLRARDEQHEQPGQSAQGAK